MSKPFSSALNFLGVTSLLGGEVSKNSLKYININDKKNKIIRILTSFLVMPGLYNVATQILKRNDNKVARIFSSGEREDRKLMLGFKVSNKYKYIGMKSGTKANISNALFENWLNKKSKLKKNNKISDSFRQNQRSTIIGFLKCTNSKSNYNIKNNKPLYSLTNLLSVIFQIVTLYFFILTIIENDNFSIFIMFLNMLSHFLIVLVLSDEKYNTPDSKVYSNVSDGNSLVTNQNGDNIWIINGKEKEIQNLLQLEIIVEEQSLNKKFEILVAVFSCITSIISLFLMSVMTDNGKFYYGINLLLGLLSGLLYSSKDGEKILEKVTDNIYTFNDLINIKFSNRATAFAYVLLVTKGYSNQLGNLIPETNEFHYYRKLLDNINKIEIINEKKIDTIIQNINNNTIFIDEIYSLKNTIFGKRLLEDILEALSEYKNNFKDKNQNINSCINIETNLLNEQNKLNYLTINKN